MLKILSKAWKYLTALLTGKFNESADPKVQLEQAIAEAQDQHRRLTEQAADVVANRTQTEIRLDRAMEEMGKLNASARQAVQMADEAAKRGDATRAQELTSAAEAYAGRLVATEKEVEDLKVLLIQSTEAATQAKAAVQQNSSTMQAKLTERQKLLSQLDQAKMQEQVNAAMASLSATVGEDVPTLEEVRDKIEARYAKALGASELAEDSVEVRMLEVEQESMNAEAAARLNSIRESLGIAAPTAGEAGEPADEPSGEPA